MELTQKQAVLDVHGPWRFKMMRPNPSLIGQKHSAVADGVRFEDGVCVLRWRTGKASTAVYSSFVDLAVVHGHDDTIFEWVDVEPTEAFLHGVSNSIQDSCENAPFGSLGGLDKRAAFIDGSGVTADLPKYVTSTMAEEWLRGYLSAFCAMNGDDWRTCPFGWAPALRVG